MNSDETIDSPGGTPPSPQRRRAAMPQRLGRYRVSSVLGSGGFGVVYRGYDEELKRDVAIKVPHPEQIDSGKAVEAFLAEARNLARLDHVAIVPIYDMGRTDEGSCYLVFKFIDGYSLADRLRRGALSQIDALAIAERIAEALHHAHHRGTIHRDVKPSNILLDRAGQPFLTDFGLSLRERELISAAGHAGTPAYMSPEQVRGEGHRLDARTDVYSLGVVLYEMLAGSWPLKGVSGEEIRRQMRKAEPTPLSRIDPGISPQLERVCQKAISRRVIDRYSTAMDLAEELRTLERSAEPRPPDLAAASLPSVPAQVSTSVHSHPTSTAPAASRIVPKGLRSFGLEDSDFFLELLPGPRDRDGMPEVIRFWKTRIEETDPQRTFAVGLIYGPSGCGKSSLVKAGLLPRLSNDVTSIYLEATTRGTEAKLLASLRRQFPLLGPEKTVREIVAALRRGEGLVGAEKVLIVIDQFEQWLHAHPDDSESELVRALRQCDGGRIQCIVMVRDDFWMAITRFMRDLEIRLVEGSNSAAVDLFGPEHAQRVLAAFGQALGSLPATEAQTTAEHREFLRQAVRGLSLDGAVIPVRLALFADMVKNRPWDSGTLREVGGMQGIGVVFLEETFCTSSAPPEHRRHQNAAKNVLARLLPESGTDIKGSMRPREDLVQAAGYADAPREFEELLRILDTELRLVTPTEVAGVNEEGPEGAIPGSAAGVKCYQLTHDYLVPAVREWLIRKQRETWRGRARLLLEEKAAAWTSTAQARFLPTALQWIRIRLMVQPRTWTVAQQRMMKRSGVRHLIRSALTLLLLALLTWGGVEGYQSLRAQALRDRLLFVSTSDAGPVLEEIARHRHRVRPLLDAAIQQARLDSRERTNLALALMPEDPGQATYLAERVLDLRSADFRMVRDALAPHRSEIQSYLWKQLEDPAVAADRRLCAALLLARFAPPEGDALISRWKRNSEFLAQRVHQLVVADPAQYTELVGELGSAGELLIDPLRKRAADPNAGESERSIALNLVVEFAGKRPEVLSDILLSTDNAARQASALSRMTGLREKSVAILTPELSRPSQNLAAAWKDAPLADAAAVGASALSSIENAQGVTNERFAFCQTMALDEFIRVADTLRAAGYRPLSVRPYRDQNGIRTAALWTRDGRVWSVETGLSEDETQKLVTGERMKSDLLVDMARYDDAAGISRFALTWCKRRSDDPEALAYIGPMGEPWTQFIAQKAADFGVTSATLQRDILGKFRLFAVLWKGSTGHLGELLTVPEYEKRLARSGSEGLQASVLVMPSYFGSSHDAWREGKSVARGWADGNLKVNPADTGQRMWQIQCESMLGEDDRVIEHATRYLEMAGAAKQDGWQIPGCHECRAVSLARKGRLAEAMKDVEARNLLVTDDVQDRWMRTTVALFTPNGRESLDSFAKWFAQRPEDSAADPSYLARAYALSAAINRSRDPQVAAQDREKAIALIEQAHALGKTATWWIGGDPSLQLLMDDPRMQRIQFEVELDAIEPVRQARHGDAAAATQTLQNYLRTSTDPPLTRQKLEILTRIFLGQDVEAFRGLEEAMADKPDSDDMRWGVGVVAYCVASEALAQGHPDRAESYRRRALELLEKHVGAQADVNAITFRRELLTLWYFAPIRSQPRFKKLLESLSCFYAAGFTSGGEFEARELHGLDASEHLRQARELIAAGYRPVSLDSAILPGANAASSASVWHRPIAEQLEEDLASRQATAAAALMRLGEPDRVWALLKHSAEPRLRSYLLHRLGPLGNDPKLLAEHLEIEKDLSVRRAIVLALGEFPDESMPGPFRQRLAAAFLEMYRSEPDAGIHSALAWLLRKWEYGNDLTKIDATMASAAIDSGRGWLVNSIGQTLVVVAGPMEFDMGSPASETGRDRDERQHRRLIPRTFAIAATDVTVADFKQFLAAHPEIEHPLRNSVEDPTRPATGVSWIQAAQFCRWLSEKEGLTEEEMCYPPAKAIDVSLRLPSNYLMRGGYRLPTEAEWEYACRAGATTSRFYGGSRILLAKYGWSREASEGHAWPVGRLKPNDLGLFDLYGNVSQWCSGAWRDYSMPDQGAIPQDTENDLQLFLEANTPRVLRGSTYQSEATAAYRSAERSRLIPRESRPDLGFRIARTIVPRDLLMARQWRRKTEDSRAIGQAADAERFLKEARSGYEAAVAASGDLDGPKIELAQMLIESNSPWKTLRATRMSSTGGATFKLLEDGSILAGGELKDTDSYTITADSDLSRIVGIQLEILPDVSLPVMGPGRSNSGNFKLNEFSMALSPGDIATLTRFDLLRPSTDLNQGEPPAIGSAVDGNPRTGWDIWTHQSERHAAVFEVAGAVLPARGATLTFKLDFLDSHQNTLGRFRLSATDDLRALHRAQLKMALMRSGASASTKLAGAYAMIQDWNACLKALPPKPRPGVEGEPTGPEKLLAALARPGLDEPAMIAALAWLDGNDVDDLSLRLADELLARVAELTPADLTVLARKASVLARQGQRLAAAADYRRLVALDPKNAEWPRRLNQLGDEVIDFWNFEFGKEGWQAARDCSIGTRKGVLHIEMFGGDASIAQPIAVPAGPMQMTIRQRNDQALNPQVYWSTLSGGESEESAETQSMPPSEAQWREATIFFYPDAPLTQLSYHIGKGRTGKCDVNSLVLRRVAWPDAIAELTHQLDLGAGDQSLLHINRGNMYASRGRWKEAAGDFTKAVGNQPRADLQQWKCMVALAQAGDEEGYRRQRRASFSALPHDVPESVARHAARAALLLPIDGEDLTAAMNLAAIGASDSASGSDRRWVEQNRGLAEYRAGRFESAVDVLLRSIKTNKASGSDACLEALSDFFLAMARARLDHAGDGVADFERGVILMEGELRRLSNGDLGYGWYEWAICDIARREAQQILTESKSDVAGSLTRAGLRLRGEGKWASGEACLALSIQLRRQEIETSASPAGSDLRFELSHNLVDLGLVRMQLNRPKEAEEALRECIKLREERPPFWGLYDATSDLGAALAAQGRMDDAEPMLVDGYEKMIGFKDAWPNRKVEAIDRIISFYSTWNKPEKAREWRLRKEKEYPVR